MAHQHEQKDTDLGVAHLAWCGTMVVQTWLQVSNDHNDCRYNSRSTNQQKLDKVPADSFLN